MILHSITSVCLTLSIFLNNYGLAYGNHKSTLAIVIDDTSSMWNDIDEVKLGANAIFDTVLRHNGSQIENFVLVTFNDEGFGDTGVKSRADTTDREVFKKALSDIWVHGGGDCPEYAMAGIKRALEGSLDRSHLYVFTDATAKDFEDFEEVKAMALKKQSQIVFVLTGQCDEPESSPAYQVYHNVADATRGKVFHIKKAEVGKVLEYVKLTISGRRTDLLDEKLPPGEHDLTFHVDAIMGEVTLSLASSKSDKPSVTVTAPDGSDVWKKILIETDQVHVYSIDVTMPGTHRVVMNNQAETHAVISAKSGIDFEPGFSAYKVPSFVDTKSRPPPGTKSHLSIKLNEGDILLKEVQILDMDNNIIMGLPLEVLDKEDKFYTTDAFDPPNTMFQIAIVGFDTKTNSTIVRKSNTPTEVQRTIPGKKIEERKPSVSGEEEVSVEYGEQHQLFCKINGYPKPTVAWRNKNNGNTIPGEITIVELPYEYMSQITLDRVYENVTYECEAINSLGSDALEIMVKTIRRTKFDVIHTPKKIKVNYQEEAEISCIVDAYPPADITWYRNGAKIIPSENVEISENKSVLIIKHTTLSDRGKYICEARNVDKRKLIYKYVDVGGIEKPEIDKSTTEVLVKKGSTVMIECKILRGKPTPSITWHHGSTSGSRQTYEMKEWANKERVTVPLYGKYDAGNYICVAKNDIDSDFHKIHIQLEYPPTIANGTKFINAEPDTKITIPCRVDGGPPPEVKWYKGAVEITNSDNMYIFGDYSLRLKVQPLDSGYYTCRATNTLGTVSKTVKLNVNVPINIKLPTETKLSKRVGSNVTLPCAAVGDPKPTIEWVYNSFSTAPLTKLIRSTREGELLLNRIQTFEEGFYTCIAKNTRGSVNITYEVHVLAPPYIKHTYLDKHFEAVEGDLTLRITCEVFGNPEPKITWTKNGNNLALGSTYYVEKGTLIIRNVPKDATGAYICEAINPLGKVQEMYQVTVHDHPPFSPPSSTTVILEGEPAEIKCAISPRVTDNLRWYKNGVFYKTGELTLTNPSMSDSGDYTCRVSDLFKSVSSTTRLTVGTKPRFVSEEDETIDMNEGMPTSLSCENYAEPMADVTWYFDNEKLNATGPVYKLTMENTSTMIFLIPGQYKCVAKNDLGFSTKTFSVTSEDCFLNTNKLSQLHPLMLTSALKWPTFDKYENYMIFLNGEQFILYCPTRFKMHNKQYLNGFCDGGMNILINGEKYDYSNIQCEEEVEHAVKKTGIECMSSNTEKISIEYSIVDGTSSQVYEICWDKNTDTPIYAMQTMSTSIADDGYEAAWSNSDHFRMTLEEIYDCENQVNTISKWLHRSFHMEDKCCFAKRQLVSPRDVFPGAPQKSTFSYFNVVPHWSTCNQDNWEEIERRVRYFAKNSYGDLQVWTGRAKELSLSSPRFTASPFFMDLSGNYQPVPMFLWKVIQDPGTQSSLAIIQINVPDLSPTEVSRYILCSDICDWIDWMRSPDWHDVKKGYTYCCSIEDFEAAFGFKGVFNPDMNYLLTMDSSNTYSSEPNAESLI